MLTFADRLIGGSVKTTKQAARAARISRQTLQTWIRNKAVTAPKPMKIGKSSVRMWTEDQVRRLVTFAKRRRNGFFS
jgi:predicted DNA-binding transcriptional regulator AlpA